MKIRSTGTKPVEVQPMLEEKHVDFGMRDIGYDAQPKVNVNIIFFRVSLLTTFVSRKNGADIVARVIE